MGKQTAVEWLIDQLEKYELYSKLSFLCLNEIEQAKEMEEQQMFEFWNGGIDCTEGGVCFDQYYNETYKKE
jgi:hypothetical protein